MSTNKISEQSKQEVIDALYREYLKAERAWEEAVSMFESDKCQEAMTRIAKAMAVVRGL